MIKLYNAFNNWKEYNNIWIVSDTHFDDKDCLLMDLDWVSPDEHVKNINSQVGRKDILIHLGDVGDEEYIKQLRGYKILLLGNHDKGASKYKKKYYSMLNDEIIEEFASYEESEEFNQEYLLDKGMSLESRHNNMFDEVYEGPLFINEKICLSHEPIELPFGYNIHGHVHSGEKVIERENSVSINVASDVVKYQPLRIDKLIEAYKVESIHRVTIDKAIERNKEAV